MRPELEGWGGRRLQHSEEREAAAKAEEARRDEADRVVNEARTEIVRQAEAQEAAVTESPLLGRSRALAPQGVAPCLAGRLPTRGPSNSPQTC